MKEEMKQLNERFDRLETKFDCLGEVLIQQREMLIQLTGIFDNITRNKDVETQKQRLNKAESDIKLN